MEEGDDDDEVLPLVRSEQRSKARSDTSSLAARARMVDTQGLSLSVVDCVLEEGILEELLCELAEINVIDVHIARSDEASSANLLVGPEVSPPVP
jgi:hypothetical protein